MAALAFCTRLPAQQQRQQQQQKQQQQQQQKQRIAVLKPYGDLGDQTNTSVREAFRSAFVATQRYITVELAAVDRAVEEQGVQRSDLSELAKVKELGRGLGADFICVLDLSRENRAASLIAAGTGQVLAAVSGPDTDAPRMFRSLMDKARAAAAPPKANAEGDVYAVGKDGTDAMIWKNGVAIRRFSGEKFPLHRCLRRRHVLSRRQLRLEERRRPLERG
jgi:hypothetical protein